MCAEFMIRASNQKITRSLGVPDTGEALEWNLHARLYSQAPVIVSESTDIEIRGMGFSLKPKGTPFPTFNARLLSWDEKKNKIVPMNEKPTWREPLKNHRCLVPMTGFIEPVYLGEHAGAMVMFKSPDDSILFCPGLYAITKDRVTGETYEGFTLALHIPSEFVLKTGHHRQPVFLEPAKAREWVKDAEMKPDQAVEFLIENRLEPELVAEKSRQMAKGWEKRVSESEKKFEKEKEFLARIRD
jgi:putative SOS response-associated peptidase YedK